MVDDKDLRQANYWGNQCTLGEQTGPQTIVVRQIIGEQQQQKVMDIHVVVPRQKPAIEQIIDVFVKDVEVNSVDILNDRVIVRGDFEIKAIYVACVPDQAVHAVEVRNVKWSQDVTIPGARRGMDADASVVVDFVDYDVHRLSRAYKYKNYVPDEEDDDEVECCETAAPTAPAAEECGPAPATETAAAAEEVVVQIQECNREFDVSIVLTVTAKVMADREVMLSPAVPPAPPMPPVAPKG
ncbi:Hypothetical protein LUCI_1805 [Lucifera butyrica]|uniref:SipL SPOCS domain-containing protein n=1 Tax=Lucifera butyrica TaxID=1351585 RepID=A0A498R5Y4_9FIRM|nr:DUF3794 domain-containing protein [Lucifera butyrica]VBB06569.1 Hypothetical protein LUCI_1805 [Lucifera butyrica]